MSRPLFMLVLIGALGAFVPVHVLAQTPRIQFRTNTYDFGRVSQGTVVHAEFVFTNVGDAMLQITDVQPGCGCTTAGEWDREVAPGKTGKIPLQFNTASFFGPVHKTPTVMCNDTSQPAIYLNIVGEIWRPVEVTPTFVLFNLASSQVSNLVQSVRVTNNLATPLVISNVISSHPTFRPVLRELQKNKDFELEIHLVPPISFGTVQGIITAKTSSPDLPVISVTAMAILQPPVTVFPNTLTLQPGPLLTPTAASFRMFVNQAVTVSNQPLSLQFTNPAVTLSNVTVNLVENQPGRLITVTLVFPAGLDLLPGTPAEFSIQTSHPDMPVIRVPITQLPRQSVVAIPPPPELPASSSSSVIRRPAPQARPQASPPPPMPPDVVLPGAPLSDK